MPYSYSNIAKVTFPLLASMLIDYLITVTDALFLGRYGQIELGAVALAGVFYMTMCMLGNGFGSGLQIIIARRNGEKNFREIGSVVQHTVFFLLSCAVGVILLYHWLGEGILSKVISSQAIKNASLDYLNIRIIGYPFAVLNVVYRVFYIGITQTKFLTFNSILAVFTNIVLNYIFIFGHCGLEPMGIKGAALASLIAEGVSFCNYSLFTLLGKNKEKYFFFSRHSYHFKVLKEILSLSIWTMISAFAAILSWFLFFVAIEHLGEKELAVSNIVRNISSFIFLVSYAISVSCNTIIGNLIGIGKKEFIPKVISRHLVLGYLVVIPLMLAIVLFPSFFLSLFTQDRDLIDFSTPILYIMLISHCVTIAANVFHLTISGGGDTRSFFLIDIVSLFVYGSFCFFGIYLAKWDVATAWLADTVYYFFILILSYGVYKRGKWIRDLKKKE